MNDQAPSPLWIGVGAALGILAVYKLGGTKNPYALLGGAWVGGTAPLVYAAYKIPSGA